MNNMFPIESEVAQKVWRQFVRELDHKLKPLPSDSREDIRLEIMSHLYESAQNDGAGTEDMRFLNAIERLGDPDDYLTPLVADIQLFQQAVKGNPAAIGRSLLKYARQSVGFALVTFLFGFAYAFLAMIVILGLSHFFMPDAGLWIHDSGSLTFSFESQPQAEMWMPGLFPWLAIVGSGVGYWLLNRLLGLLLRKAS